MPRSAGQAAHFDVVVGDYTLRCVPDGLSSEFEEDRRHATLAETFDLHAEGRGPASSRLLAYDLRQPRRLWEDSTEMGFLGWERHGDVVLMAGELELAAWTTAGEKLWTIFVEPPWQHAVQGETVRLDVMGAVEHFPLRTGPRRATPR